MDTNNPILGAQCIDNSIRLIGELSQYEGIVLICRGGSWGKVCGEYYRNQQASRVICRQLGFSSQGQLLIITVVLLIINYDLFRWSFILV